MVQTVRLILFGLASLLILGIISAKVFLAERAVRYGATYRFAIQGYDPRDVFRGRYLAIRMDNSARRSTLPEKHGRAGWATIGRDEKGIAFFDELRATPPSSGESLAVTLNRWNNTTFQPPFTRFYLNEKLAPEAENVLNQKLAQGKNVLLRLKVYRNYACIEDLEIDGKSIRVLAREAAK